MERYGRARQGGGGDADDVDRLQMIIEDMRIAC
jgi:hypothetical protein